MKNIFYKCTITIAAILTFSTASFSQNWAFLGEGVPGFVQASCMMGDSLVVAYPLSMYSWNNDTVQVAIWNGTIFAPLDYMIIPPGGYDSMVVNDMIVYNGELYVAGNFDSINGMSGTKDIIKWSGTQWESVGGGADADGYVGITHLEVYNNELYALGDFTGMGGVANYMARWDGTQWNSIPVSNMNVWDITGMKAYGGYLFLSGYFAGVNNVPAKGIAKWDGTTWSDVNGSMTGSNPYGRALGVYNNELFISGDFTQIGGMNIQYMAYWDGSTWHDGTSGLSGSNTVYSMCEHGSELWASGYFYPNMGTRYLMHWNGTSWTYETNGNLPWKQLQSSSQTLYGTGNYNNWYGNNYYNVEFWCENNTCGSISGTVYADVNLNCTNDYSEDKFPGILVSVGNNFTTTDSNGFYNISILPGSYNITHMPKLYHVAECPASNNINANVSISVPVVDANFGDTIDHYIQDLSGYVASTTGWVARVDSDVQYQITCNNLGTMAVSSGSLEFHLDPNVIYLSSTPLPASINSNVYTWNFTNLNPGEADTFYMTVHIPGNLVLHSYLHDTVIVNPFNGDDAQFNNTLEFDQIVGNAWDPNDKQVSPMGVGSDGEILLSDSVLTYHVDFQNTGNAVAHNITIVDTLSNAVNPFTIQFLTSSHPYSYSMKSPGIVHFDFEHIELPDSNSNEPGSHGFVEYSIHLKQNLPFGTQIQNTASIYFDSNQPVQTNTVLNTLVKDAGIPSSVQQGSLAIFPNPANEYFNVRNEGNFSQSVQVENALGQIVFALDVPAKTTLQIDTKFWAEGIYFVHSSLSGNEKILIQR